MELLDYIKFASDAEMAGLWGLVLILIACFAIWAERRRSRKSGFEGSGWVPWMGIFLACAFIGAALVLVSVRALLAA